jgi:DNA-binding transcriptional MerR regulator
MSSMVESAEQVQWFSGTQVCKLVGITYRQLDYWARTGLLVPSIAEAKGSGTKRRYSYQNVVELKVIKQLLDAGVSLQRARQAVDCLRENLNADLASASLILSSSSSVLAADSGAIVDLLAGGQGVLNVVPMGGLVSDLDASIIEITSASAVEPDARRARTA